LRIASAVPFAVVTFRNRTAVVSGASNPELIAVVFVNVRRRNGPAVSGTDSTTNVTGAVVVTVNPKVVAAPTSRSETTVPVVDRS
jgi:hypothetical protein